MPVRTRLLIPLACALSGCVTVPETLQGEYVLEAQPDSVTEDQQDQSVRWGGLLHATWSEDGETCMELVARPLDRWYRPDFGKVATGRFLACKAGPLDPEEFFPGRDVTLVGVFKGFVEGQVGDDAHRFPFVHVGSVHVWPLPAQFNDGPQRTQQGGQGESGWADRQVDRQEKIRAVRSINQKRH